MFTVTKVTEGNVHQTGVVGLPDKKWLNLVQPNSVYTKLKD